MKNRLYTTALALLIALLALPATAATSTRSSSFEYDAESGLLTKEIIEPNDSKLCLVTEYGYDSKFGNKISVTTRNCDGRAGEAPAPSAAPTSVNATLAYFCPAGSALSGTDCITGAIPATLTHSCPAGYTRSGASCTLTIAATAVYGCPAGYTLSGTTCSHTVTATNQPQTVLFNMTDGGSFTRTVQTNKCTSLGGTVNWASQCVKLAYYSCPSDYTLSETSCTITEPATASPSCPVGQTLSGTNCTAIIAATVAYSCATNYTLTGTTCFPLGGTGTSDGTVTPASSAYNCPEGQTLSGTLCLTNANDAVIASRTTRTTFDARGQFAETTTNALNHTETRTFDPRFGAITRLTGPNGLITTWTYDGFGRKKTETRADNTSTAWEYLVGNINGALDNGALYANIKYTILTQIKDSAGVLNAGMSTYDYYDLLGRKLVSSRRNFTDTTWIDEGRVEYDALGRVVKSYLPHDRNTFSATTTPSATAGYDLLGRPLVQTAADGSRVEMQYAGLVQTVYQTPDINTTKKLVKTTTRNVLGQTVKVVDALGYQLKYTYDTFGNLLTTTDHAGNITRLKYDARGRKSKMIDPDMGTWFYYYNALGELIRQKDAKNQAVTMTYDALGRMLSRSEPGLNSTWVYDTAAYGKGKLARASTDNGYSRTHSYDIKGRLSATSTIIGTTAYVTGVTYDTFGRVDVQTYPTGFAVKNKYSGAGYLTSVVNNATQTTAYWTANSMDAAGHLLEQTYHNGLKVTQSFYGDTGRLKTQLALDANAAKRQEMNYTYDTLGNLKTRNDGVNGLGELFSYDDLNRLENATVNSGGINAMTSVAYSAIGNITRKTLLTTAANGAQTLSDAGNYTYNPSGANSIRPHAVTGIAQAVAVAGASVTNTTGMLNGRANPTFTYDANGNMLTGAGRTIAWTSFNIPSQITSCPPDATGTACKTTRFVYNSEHERTTEYLADGSTVHVLSPRYDTGLHFEKRVKVDGSIEYEHYLYAGGLMFGKYVTHTNAAGAAIQSTDMAGTQRSRVIEYYLKDHLGSITAQVNGDANPALLPNGTANPEAGKYAVRYLSYDVWGKKRYSDGVPDTTGALNNPDMYHGYTGHEMLDEVGLIHMNGRLYDPVLGRFVSADFLIPNASDLQSYNRYSYLANNPLGSTDPSGQCELVCMAFIAIVSSEVAYQAGIIDKGTARAIQGISVAIALGPQFGTEGLISSGITSDVFASTLVAGGAGGFVSSDFSPEGAVQGAISAGLFYGAGSFAGTTMGGGGIWVHGGIGRVMAHAAAGCAGAMASGGSCGRGAMTAGFSEGIGGNLGEHDGVVARAVLGGTVSVIGGGKFSNGAVTGAYGYLFNECAHGQCKILGGMKLDPTLSKTNVEKAQTALAVTGTALQIAGLVVAATPAAPVAPFLEAAGYGVTAAAIVLDPSLENFLSSATGVVGRIIQPFSAAAAATYNQYHVIFSTYEASTLAMDHNFGN